MLTILQQVLYIVASASFAHIYIVRPVIAIAFLLGLSSTSRINPPQIEAKGELWGVIWKPYAFLVFVALAVAASRAVQ